jgi:RepB DNA-primase from phage plasmid
MEPYSFMTIRTSPGNFQVWIAVSDGPKDPDESRPARTDEEKALRARQKEAAKQFHIRVRKGAGADKSATGATRIAGSLNFKKKYAPNFPVITLSQVSEGRVTTTAALQQAGLVAEVEQPSPPASVPPRIFPPRAVADRRWADYQLALRGAPLKKDGSGPDRSLADYMFCRWNAQRGWTKDEIAAKLLETSEKAQEAASRGDENYASVTAWNAVQAVERERGRQPAKSARRSG